MYCTVSRTSWWIFISYHTSSYIVNLYDFYFLNLCTSPCLPLSQLASFVNVLLNFINSLKLHHFWIHNLLNSNTVLFFLFWFFCKTCLTFLKSTKFWIFTVIKTFWTFLFGRNHYLNQYFRLFLKKTILDPCCTS